MIQVIEDDLVTCRIITALLKRMQVPWCQAHTGEEALEQLRTLPIALVIMDMVLPDMHGLELLGRKHNLPAVSDVPVICCTADAHTETVDAAMKFGAMDFVTKPIVVPAFIERVRRAMEMAPVRWQGDDTEHPSGSIARTVLVATSHLLRELDEALAMAQQHGVTLSELNAMIARARSAAVSAGAVRTVRQLDRLWQRNGTRAEIDALREALVIEFAAFDAAIQAEGAQPALMIVNS